MPKTGNEILQILARVLQSISEYMMISVLLIALLIASYALWDVNDTGQRAQPEKYEIYKPKEDKKSFDELIKINDEVIGWINIYGTNIDYPVLQAEDNEKYLSIAADGKYQTSGSIFLDFRNERDFSDFNNIIYGHSMAYNAMFGDVRDFEDKSFYDSHRYGDLFFDGRHHGLRIIGFVQADAYLTGLCKPKILTDDEKASFFEEIKSTGTYQVDESELDYGYTYVLLYTCQTASTNGRDMLICRLTDETYLDPFGGDRKTDDSVDGGRLRIKLFIIVLIILAILLASAYAMRKSEQRERRKAQTRDIEI